MTYLTNLNEEIKSGNSHHLSANIITFIEDAPYYVLPPFYKYEGGVYEREGQVYKDKTVIEKVNNF